MSTKQASDSEIDAEPDMPSPADEQHREYSSSTESNFRQETPWNNTTSITVGPTGSVTTERPEPEGDGRETTILGDTIDELCEDL